MSIKYNFNTENADWIGKYTIGYVSVRGTRLWFRPPYVKSFGSGGMKLFIEMHNTLLKGNTTFPGDCFNLRSESLQIIIDELMEKVETPTCCKFYNGTIYDIISDFNSNSSDSFSDSFSDNSNSLMHQVFEDYDSDDDSDEIPLENYKCRFNTEIPMFTVIDIECEDMWLMTEKDKIINELEEVLDHCNKNNVRWLWV